MIPRFPGQPNKDLTRPIERVEVVIDARQDGCRLDVALGHFLTWRSRTSIHRLIRDGYVRLEGRGARPATKVRRGETIVVHVPQRPEPDFDTAPQGFEIPILYEDRYMIAVDKPPGVAVHPSGRRVYGTLIHFLHRRYRRPDDPAHDVIPRLMHRLDRETSGVVCAGLDEDFHALVSGQFETRQVTKTYLAVVHGVPNPSAGEIELGIGPARDTEVRLKLEARHDGSGLPALTHYRTVRARGPYALVELKPRTGRTHQLRVHMAAIGCPLVGDKIYGVPDEVFLEHLREELSDATRELLVLDRHALHAHQLEFHHPHRGERLTLSAPLPADMAGLVPE